MSELRAHNTDRWKIEQRNRALRQEPITYVFSRKRHSEWLRGLLKSLGVAYRVFKIGDARIVSTEPVCPCCNRGME